ncbi:hypothetical protein QL285_048000 [Trifolium repens]|nr:hypothetical protein QL285_048000 [Trifolium repens]
MTCGRLICGLLRMGDSFGSSYCGPSTEQRQRTMMEDNLSPLIHIIFLSPKSPANADMVNLYLGNTRQPSQPLLVEAFGTLHNVSNTVPSVEPK